MLPNLQVLERISQRIQSIPNNHGEFKRREHYGLFLLCYQAGLRVSEAINFDLSAKTHRGLFLIKSKGKKNRYVYVPKKVISELKKCEWKPKQTNRFNFYHFLRRIKKSLEIPANTELTPHTLRRSFATYHAEAGLPLPLLQKLLGHQSIRTTALYWMNTYHGDDDDDTTDILAGKFWLEKPKPPQPEPDNPVKVNLDKLPKPLTPDLSLFSPIQAKHLTKINQLEEQLSQIQRENKSLKSKLAQAKEQNETLQSDLAELSEQNSLLHQQKTHVAKQKEQIQQDLTTTKETISQLIQDLASEQEKRTIAENNFAHEKQINHNLRQQLKNEQETNTNLTQKLNHSEQNLTNIQNAYQQALKDKQIAEKQLNYLTNEIKKAAQQFYQWQKLNYYQQLERERQTLEAKIIHPPPWKKT
ncbi:tyrosine-type recombinase/integrase [endosymbiont GvMRE of Glomus versiforme]|uniref:tyrosine-type recombinase/integrase n=1 Tax=endosymbiont GvMRE of Glomus versiforme TaxID=2039283 RepID=UPI000EE943B2|nr:site-specific integrase [endosymbiont GvMRE of Glomus versiforme]RHZ35912.1 Tyrosine recombinase XerD [endosymbiont GvMRE of Glomus versiforme]